MVGARSGIINMKVVKYHGMYFLCFIFLALLIAKTGEIVTHWQD